MLRSIHGAMRTRMPGDRHRRADLLCTVCTAAALLFCIFSIVTPSASMFGRVAAGVCGFGYAVLLAVAWARRRFTRWMCVYFVVVSCLLITALDLVGMSIFARKWVLFIVVLDGILLAGLPRWISNCVIAYVAVYMVLGQLELTYRFGMLDIPGMHDYDKRRRVCDCAHPPCATDDPWPTVAYSGVPQVFAFLLDFYLTRSFAERAAAERGTREAAIAAAQTVTEKLASFDLAAADTHLEDHQDTLPAELYTSLRRLSHNLGSYLPYLPGEFFASAPADVRDSLGQECFVDAMTPPTGTSHVAIVFTDIRQSTALWAHSGDAMLEALRRHNTLIRAAISDHRGYEVKTVGDSFMVVFKSVRDAVCFGVAVQQELATTIWPPGLTRPEADDGFGMLALRIGVHCGVVSTEQNVLTRRFDCFGSCVNKAARVEANGVAGTVTVTDEVVDAVGPVLEDFIVMPYPDDRVGKGLTEPLRLTAIMAANTTEEAQQRVKEELTCALPQHSPKLTPVPDTAALSSFSSERTSSLAIHLPPRVFERHHRAAASVGVVKFDTWSATEAVAFDVPAAEERVEQRLQALHACLVYTGGRLSATINNMAILSWGVHGRCNQPICESARFLLRLYREFKDDGGFHAGLASGEVASGQIEASAAQRFVTLMGPCVDLALVLCSGAAEMGVPALVASMSGANTERYNLDPVLCDHTRRVDNWQLCPALPVLPVFELVLASLAMDVSGPARAGPAAEWGGTDMWTEVASVDTVSDKRLHHAMLRVRDVQLVPAVSTAERRRQSLEHEDARSLDALHPLRRIPSQRHRVVLADLHDEPPTAVTRSATPQSSYWAASPIMRFSAH